MLLFLTGCGKVHDDICDPDVKQHCDLVDQLAQFLVETNQILEQMNDVESANLHRLEFNQKLNEFAAIHGQLESLPELNECQDAIFERTPSVCRLQSVSSNLANTLRTMQVSHPDEPVFEEISDQIDLFIVQAIRQGAEEVHRNPMVQ